MTDPAGPGSGPAGRDRDVAGPASDPAGPASDRAGRGSGGARRDRDLAGRPRNARPRDALGRPLPKSAAGEPRVPDDLILAPDAALDSADDLIVSGRPFHAHEVLEASWKAAPDTERAFWQGLAQLAVGLTHAQRGNARGAVALLRRSAARIRGYSPANPYSVDAAAVAAEAERLANRIEADGLDTLPGGSLRLRLRPVPGNGRLYSAATRVALPGFRRGTAGCSIP